MKKLLLSYALLCLVQSFAQNNVAMHDAMNLPCNIVSINSKCYYVERHGSDCCGDDIRIIGINKTGQIFSMLSLPTSPSYVSLNNYPVKIIKTLNDQLLVIGYVRQNMCMGDVYFSGVKNRIIKVDTNGTVLFDGLIQTPLNGSGNMGLSDESIVDIVQHSNGTFYAVSDSTIYQCAATGSTVGTPFYIHQHIRSITALANNNLLFSTENNGVKRLIETTTTGSVISQFTVSSVITKFIESSSGLYGLTSLGGLEKYSPGLSLINSVTIPSVTLTDLALRNDSVFVTGVSNPGVANRPFYAVLNASLSVGYQSHGAYNNNAPTGIAVNNVNGVYIVATGSSTNTGVTYSNVYGLTTAGVFASHSDIGVQSIAITSSSFVPAYFPWGMNGPAYPPSAIFNADITIKNYGTTTVTSFCLNHTSDYAFCSSFFKQYTVTIPPGGTVTVSTGTLFSHFIPNTYTMPSNTPVQLQECFFTTVPNASGDSSIGNDAACAQFTVNYVTGIASYVLSAADVELYPNPFTTAFAVKTSAIIKTVEVYNVVGALLHKETVNAGTATMDQSALPAGVYFVKLETEKGTITRKVIKE